MAKLLTQKYKKNSTKFLKMITMGRKNMFPIQSLFYIHAKLTAKHFEHKICLETFFLCKTCALLFSSLS